MMTYNVVEFLILAWNTWGAQLNKEVLVLLILLAVDNVEGDDFPKWLVDSYVTSRHKLNLLSLLILEHNFTFGSIVVFTVAGWSLDSAVWNENGTTGTRFTDNL